MNEKKAFLKKISIHNFLSLRNVVLPLKPLTIIVGPNASGKSNILQALDLLSDMMRNEEPPPVDFIKDRIWAGGSDGIEIKVEMDINEKTASYHIKLRPDENQRVAFEKLVIDKVKVISIRLGKGKVKDENNSNSVDYKSNKIALKSAGDYGNKPITNDVRKYIRDWDFYDIDPFRIRQWKNIINIGPFIKDMIKMQQLDSTGINLHPLLSNWYENAKDQFESVNDILNRGFKSKTKLDMQKRGKEEDGELVLLEGYPNSIPMDKGSDGTLRLIAYQVLMNQPKLPSLIAIEEPERNFHPAWLKLLNDILVQLSKRTQVIITTHSSQLLDTFSSQYLDDNLSVLLVHNIASKGTEVIPLDKVKKDREGLKNWIEEFGIGSAIFDSELLQDIMEA